MQNWLKKERVKKKDCEIAKYQLDILNNAEKIKLLGDSKENKGQV